MKSLNAVIRALEKCTDWEAECEGCPYHDDNKGGLECEMRNLEEVLDYLKEYRDRQTDLDKEIDYWRKQNDVVVNLVTMLKAQKPNILCKECKYYDEDVWIDPIIVAHHRCRKWAGGCVTEPEGFCHMGEKKE